MLAVPYVLVFCHKKQESPFVCFVSPWGKLLVVAVKPR
jgi:hypothetical protein